MAAASPRTWRGAAQRASRSTSLRAQSAKFAVTGALAALIDVSLTWLLQIGFGLLSADPARAVGFIVGTWAAYLLNRRWTFKAKSTAVRFAGVLATYGVTFVVNMVAYKFFRRPLGVELHSLPRGGVCHLAGHRHRGELRGAALDYF